jgi:hypothetical protein
MIPFFSRPKRLYQVSDAIFHCVKMLIVYRMKNDEAFKSQLIANGGNPKYIESEVDKVSEKNLSLSIEYYIIFLMAMFITLQRKDGKRSSFKDIVCKIDKELPTPSEYIPIETWMLKNYREYVAYRLKIDFVGRPYPNFVIDDLYDEIYSYLSENFHYDKIFYF